MLLTPQTSQPKWQTMRLRKLMRPLTRQMLRQIPVCTLLKNQEILGRINLTAIIMTEIMATMTEIMATIKETMSSDQQSLS